MKEIANFFLIVAITLVACQQTSESSPPESPGQELITEEEALGLLHKWTRAYLMGDAEPLQQVLDESWLYSGSSDGSITGKAAAIEEFSKADYRFADIAYENLEVKLYGDVAVVRGSEKMVIVGSSQDTTELSLRFTDVYQKKNGEVKAIASHSSPIESD